MKKIIPEKIENSIHAALLSGCFLLTAALSYRFGVLHIHLSAILILLFAIYYRENPNILNRPINYIKNLFKNAFYKNPMPRVVLDEQSLQEALSMWEDRQKCSNFIIQCLSIASNANIFTAISQIAVNRIFTLTSKMAYLQENQLSFDQFAQYYYYLKKIITQAEIKPYLYNKEKHQMIDLNNYLNLTPQWTKDLSEQQEKVLSLKVTKSQKNNKLYLYQRK